MSLVIVINTTTAGVGGAGNDQVRALARFVSQQHQLAAGGVLRLRIRARRTAHPTQPSAEVAAKHLSATGCTENATMHV